ncbi:DMT family transporter [Rhodanobacter aciditrophus]|uniref:Guanidinium exporter n=1 Tax=Rhodanobacter aciditrophus TaxID=1623218 RepID=A0ABW4B017_9GAMM
MAWVYLILAGLTEIGWPLGMKIAQTSAVKWPGLMMAVVFMVVSGTFLFMAQKHIPLGTAYAVWTGIGAAGTFLVGVMVFGDATSLMRYIGILLIISGVVVLKLAH